MEQRSPYGWVIVPSKHTASSKPGCRRFGDTGTQTLGPPTLESVPPRYVEIVFCQWWICPYCFLHILVNSSFRYVSPCFLCDSVTLSKMLYSMQWKNVCPYHCSFGSCFKRIKTSERMSRSFGNIVLQY